jgi:hypothetical protein
VESSGVQEQAATPCISERQKYKQATNKQYNQNTTEAKKKKKKKIRTNPRLVTCLVANC